MEDHKKSFISWLPYEVLMSPIEDRSLRLYLIIMNLANEKGYAWPSNKYLSEQLKCSISTVQRALKDLETHNCISSVLKLKPNGEVEFRFLTPLITINTIKEKSTKTKIEKVKTNPLDDMDFLEFYQLYPRKINQKLAKDEFNKLNSQEKEKALSVINLFKQATDKWSESDKKYIPSPHNWIANKRFEDDPKEWEKTLITKSVTKVYKNEQIESTGGRQSWK